MPNAEQTGRPFPSASLPVGDPRLRFEPQPFETGVFGVPVGRLAIEGAGLPSADRVRRMIEAWRRHGQWLVSCRLPEAAGDTRRLLEDEGFRRVERLLTYRAALDRDAAPAGGVAEAERTDADAIGRIGRAAFTFDRFHADPEIPDSLADRLKETWARNGLAGRADATLVARDETGVAGFVLCMLADADAVIDLIAVAPDRRGRGVGRRLVAGATQRYRGRAGSMRVGTQADNEASVRLYEGIGFERVHAEVTLHWTNRLVRP